MGDKSIVEVGTSPIKLDKGIGKFINDETLVTLLSVKSILLGSSDSIGVISWPKTYSGVSILLSLKYSVICLVWCTTSGLPKAGDDRLELERPPRLEVGV